MKEQQTCGMDDPFLTIQSPPPPPPLPPRQVDFPVIVLDDDEEGDELDLYGNDDMEFSPEEAPAIVVDLVDDGALSDGEHPELGPNWRMRALFNGRCAEGDLPANCERPQSSAGRSFPSTEPRFYQLDSWYTAHSNEMAATTWDDDGGGVSTGVNVRPWQAHAHNVQRQRRQPPPPVTVATASAKALAKTTTAAAAVRLKPVVNENVAMNIDTTVTQASAVKNTTDNHSQGYVLANGRTWVRKRPANYGLAPVRHVESVSKVTAPVPPIAAQTAPAPARHHRPPAVNNSMRIINGKRIYGGSNECFRFANGGQCASGIFCGYEHNGSIEHSAIRVCARLLRGLCRNGADCPLGDHTAIEKHQLPICDYYLRMMCVHEDCPYLHVKHTDGVEPCSAFNRGCCGMGVMCNQPHHYYYSVVKQHGEQKDGESDVDVPIGGGRPTRRSAAAASKNAWQALMPHKKGALSGGEEDDGSDSYTSERPTPTPRSRKRVAQPQSLGGQRKRVRTPKTLKAVEEHFEEDDGSDSESAPSPSAKASKPATSSGRSAGRKVLTPHQQSKRKLSVDGAEDKPSAAKLKKAADASPTIQPIKSLPAKSASPQKTGASSQKASLVAALTVTHPLVIRPKASILGKRATILAPKEETKADDDAVTGQQTHHQQSLLKSGAGAMSKEELEEIEREVQKHGFDDPNGGGDAGHQRDGSHKSEDGDDYPAGPSAKPRPNFTGRVSRGGGTTRASSAHGTPSARGGRGSRGGGRSNAGRPRGSGGRTNTANSTREYRAAGSVVGPAIMRDPSRLPAPGTGGTVKVLRIRQNPAGGGPRPAGANILMSSSGSGGGPLRSSVGASLGAYLPMYANLSREIVDTAQRYNDRVVPGTTIQEFNGIIDEVTQELNRVIDEKMRMRDWMDQVAMARAAENDMKDKKIQELEYTVELLQSKLMVAMKRIQLNALKHDTARKLVGSEATAPPKFTDSQGGEMADSQAGDGPTTAPSEDSVARRPAPTRVFAPRPLQQKLTLGSGGRPQMNPFHYYDEGREDDGEEEDQEDGDEQPAPRTGGRIVGLPVSGPGGGSIFKSSDRDVPMPLNAMNGRRVVFAGGRPFPPQCFRDSEDGYDDEEEEEDGDMDEDEAEGPLSLTAAERRNLANLASCNGGVLLKGAGPSAENGGLSAEAEDSVESMPIGAEEMVDGSDIVANQTVL